MASHLDTKRMRELRESAGLTQSAAAEKAGVSRQRWNDLESGRKSNIELDTLAAIAKALGVKAKDLLR